MATLTESLRRSSWDATSASQASGDRHPGSHRQPLYSAYKERNFKRIEEATSASRKPMQAKTLHKGHTCEPDLRPPAYPRRKIQH